MSVALRSLSTAAALLLWQIEAAPARSLDMIRGTGALHLCAHPNSLPYANKAGNPPGFQIELGKALAKELGVTLVTEWIVVPSQASRADCDIILDAIADPEAQADTGLQISKPYYRSGVGLAVPRGSTITAFATLNEHTKVGVQVGSVAAMLLSQQHVEPRPLVLKKTCSRHSSRARCGRGDAGLRRLLQSDPSVSGVRYPIA